MVLKNSFLVFFVIVNLVLCIFYLDTWRNDNTRSRAMAVHALVEDGTLQIDAYQNKCIDISKVGEHYYSDKAPLPAFITSFFYQLIRWMGAPADAENFKPILLTADIVCSVLPFLGILLLTFLTAGKSSKSALLPLICMSAFYGSFIFCFAGSFFSHVITSFFILLTYYYIKFKKNYLLSGVFTACAFCCEYTIALIAVIWFFQIALNEKSIRPALRYFAGTLPGILLIGIYNWNITGSPFEMLYTHLSHPDFAEQKINFGFRLPTLEAIIGLSVSPYRGLFLYAPFLLLAGLPALSLLFKNKLSLKNMWGNYLIPFSIVFFIVISAYRMWWGGWSYGPRHLMPLATILLFEGVILLSSTRINGVLIFLLSYLSVIITWVAKSTIAYSVPTEIKMPFSDYIFIEFFQKHFNPNNILSLLYTTNPVIANYLWICIFILLSALLTLLYAKKYFNIAQR